MKVTAIPTTCLVVAAALIAPDGRVLMQQRRKTAQHGGLWEFPGGKVEAEETPEIALCRELGEELGIVVDPADLAEVSFASSAFAGESGMRPLVILLYICRRWQGDPLCLDGEQIDWRQVADLAALPMPPLDYPLAAALFDYLKKELK